ncbi:hypothetical protein A11S_1921 [Micavibrio aeruginosavorus EPB]|uniref:Uncharacterized protein n=1 Tax=Micavibrio aeruginosavorus EPB TaxID=349215 RepID=M4VH60_9BACT|nr:hypothetical protein A11S_1921 [Micavibrio aeruginosavorus EPB]
MNIVIFCAVSLQFRENGKKLIGGGMYDTDRILIATRVFFRTRKTHANNAAHRLMY